MPSQESLGTRESSPLREVSRATPEQVRLTGEGISHAHRLSQQHAQVELGERFVYARAYDSRIDRLWLNGPENIADTNPTEVKRARTEDLSEKEKLSQYGKLADLSYVRLRTNTQKQGNDRYGFMSVNLDPLSYPNINQIIRGESVAELTQEEQRLYDFMHDPKNREKIDYSKKIGAENNLLLTKLGLGEQLLAEGDHILSDIMPETVYDREILQKRYLLDMFFDSTGIIRESKRNFEDLKQNFHIIDYFPNETKNDHNESGFGAICLEKDGRKYIAIQGTDATDWRDLLEDSKMIVGSIPDRQAKDMIRFIDRCITSGEKFSVVGHSLGGALSQMATAMYPHQVEETYTFSSPGARKLEVNDNDRQEFAKLDTFMYNRRSDEVQTKVVNVKGDRGPSLIANLGEDIGDHEIVLKNLRSHSIRDMIKYIDALDEGSEELKRVYVGTEKKLDKTKIQK